MKKSTLRKPILILCIAAGVLVFTAILLYIAGACTKDAQQYLLDLSNLNIWFTRLLFAPGHYGSSVGNSVMLYAFLLIPLGLGVWWLVRIIKRKEFIHISPLIGLVITTIVNAAYFIMYLAILYDHGRLPYVAMLPFFGFLFSLFSLLCFIAAFVLSLILKGNKKPANKNRYAKNNAYGIYGQPSPYGANPYATGYMNKNDIAAAQQAPQPQPAPAPQNNPYLNPNNPYMTGYMNKNDIAAAQQAPQPQPAPQPAPAVQNNPYMNPNNPYMTGYMNKNDIAAAQQAPQPQPAPAPQPAIAPQPAPADEEDYYSFDENEPTPTNSEPAPVNAEKEAVVPDEEKPVAPKPLPKKVEKPAPKVAPTKIEKPEPKPAPKKVEKPSKKPAVKKTVISEQEHAFAGDLNGKVLHVQKREELNKWEVKIEGANKALKLLNTQKEATDYADGLVFGTTGTVKVHKVDGDVRYHEQIDDRVAKGKAKVVNKKK